MLSVPGAKTVRGYSMFGDSFVYILFEDGTDPYWARSRVLEYLNQVQSRLPPQAKTSLGPDATGVGWVYEYALVDRSGRMDLSQLRALQDWFLKYELKAVTNVSEVASIGGMVKQYQIVLDPVRLRAFNIPQAKVIEAVQRGNQETGGSVLELGEAEYMVRASGYLQSLDDFRKIPLSVSDSGVPVRLADVARVQVGPEMRRGIAELDGEGEVAGGVIVMRSGKNALETIDAVKAKIASLKPSLPPGVEIVPTYDRSALIKRAVSNLGQKLIEEFVVVALVCVLFLFHLRSAFVAIVSLPLGILVAFIVMYYQGVNANIMSLGGIAIAIGAMAAAAGLAVTLIPVLMGYLIRGRIPAEERNPINRFLIALYRPLLEGALCRPKTVLLVAVAILVATLWPMNRLGGEFMPPLDEGDLLYMPSALPGLSAGKAAELLQQTDRLIKTVPEVASVFGKAGRAETATDPAPLEMFETTIQLKPREQWRPGMTPEKLVDELDRIVKVPGLSNIWVPPIRNRIDMLATGIKSPVGVKVAGTNLSEIDRVAAEIERVVKEVPGVSSALAERLGGGRYIDVNIDRDAAARYGLNVADVHTVVTAAIGGDNIGETVEGLQRFPINVRYPREMRDSVEKIRALPLLTDRGAQIRLGDVAEVKISDGPPMLKSENARLSGWVYVDIRGRDLSSAVRDMQRAVTEKMKLPAGMSISWSGQFEFLERATARLKIVVPGTLAIIFVLLYFAFRRVAEALLIMTTLPFALVGGFWLMYVLGYNMSIASAVGFIALAGVAAEIGVVMLVYVNQAVAAREAAGGLRGEGDLAQAIVEGAALRVRPVAMTVAVIIAGLLPIMFGSGTGSEVMRRIASPMVGGMITAPLLSMFVVPVAYLLMRRPRAAAAEQADARNAVPQP